MDQPKAPQPRDRRWRRRTEIAALAVIPLLGVVVAVLAWRYPVLADRTDGASTPPTSRVTSGANTSAGPSAQRPLADLPATSGQANIELADDPGGTGRTVTIHCGSGASDDRFREVEYALRGSYREFTADVVAAAVPEPELKTQLEVFADGVRTANVILTGGESTGLTAAIAAKQTMRLRVTCEHRDAMLVLHNAAVLG